MIKPINNVLISGFINKYIDFIINLNFRKINVINNKIFDDSVIVNEIGNQSILAISNHFSWWDGFWVSHFSRKYLKKRFHCMMLEEKLKENPLLRYIGAFSIRKKSKTILDSLSYVREKLDNENNFVLIFPQGQIESMHCDNIKFGKSIEYLLSKEYKKYEKTLMFMYCLLEYGSYPKPSVFIYYCLFNGDIYKDYKYSTKKISKDYKLFCRRSIDLNLNNFHPEL